VGREMTMAFDFVIAMESVNDFADLESYFVFYHKYLMQRFVDHQMVE
jgi:hypothetical protein